MNKKTVYKNKTVYDYKNSVLERLQSMTNVLVPHLTHYYDIKYPYLNYPLRMADGSQWLMYSIPVVGLVQLYRKYVGGRPGSFFDCGCASGELIRQAEEMGINAQGIDIKQYMFDNVQCQKYFDSGRIQIKSILDYNIVDADLAFCNGTLTYMNTETLPLALSKFKRVGMLVAIHNTTEDIHAANEMGWTLSHGEPRLIRSKSWWMDTFRKNGFNVEYDNEYQCFCAKPNTMIGAYNKVAYNQYAYRQK